MPKVHCRRAFGVRGGGAELLREHVELLGRPAVRSRRRSRRPRLPDDGRHDGREVLLRVVAAVEVRGARGQRHRRQLIHDLERGQVERIAARLQAQSLESELSGADIGVRRVERAPVGGQRIGVARTAGIEGGHVVPIGVLVEERRRDLQRGERGDGERGAQHVGIAPPGMRLIGSPRDGADMVDVAALSLVPGADAKTHLVLDDRASEGAAELIARAAASRWWRRRRGCSRCTG